MNISYDYSKHRLYFSDADTSIYFRLPITFPIFNLEIDSPITTIRYILVLIQSGHAAVGYFEGEKMFDHKVIKAYMVRGTQGISQIKYLKTRGKSKAGSRVRLANTVNFFENINQRLQVYFNFGNIDRIALSCSKTLIPFLFKSKVACPFDKKDRRVYKIPKDLNIPNFEVLKLAHHYLMHGD